MRETIIHRNCGDPRRVCDSDDRGEHNASEPQGFHEMERNAAESSRHAEGSSNSSNRSETRPGFGEAAGVETEQKLQYVDQKSFNSQSHTCLQCHSKQRRWWRKSKREVQGTNRQTEVAPTQTDTQLMELEAPTRAEREFETNQRVRLSSTERIPLAQALKLAATGKQVTKASASATNGETASNDSTHEEQTQDAIRSGVRTDLGEFDEKSRRSCWLMNEFGCDIAGGPHAEIPV